MHRNSVFALLLTFGTITGAAAQTTAGGAHDPAIAQGDSAYVLFVGLESEDAVAVVDPQAGLVLKKIPVGISTEDIEGVHALTTSPDGRYYYLSIAHGWPYGSVWKMTTERDSLVARTNVGLFPATMAITPDGTWLFVANYNLHGDPALDSVSAVHTPTMTEVAQIPVCTKPHGMVASHDGKWIYTSCTRDNVVRKISVASLAVVDSTNMLTEQDRAENKVCYPAGLALSADDSKLYVACHRHAEVRVMSTDALGRVTNVIPTGDGPYLIRMDPRSERLWVPNRNDQTYTVIDVASERPVATLPASASHPHTFAFGPDGTAYLSMESHAIVPGAIDVIDPETLETLRSIPVGLQATGVGAVPLAPSHFQ
jgi:DNA-binding beta-propeller fold protein YncE